ncbi:MAG: prepilin-type N-terminal cleavage/methylation domain-containing protein, partial [bacterium]
MKTSGFTLVELLIVFAMLGFIGILSYNGITNSLEYLSL